MQRCIPEVFLGPSFYERDAAKPELERPGVSGFSKSGAPPRAFLNEPRIPTQEHATRCRPRTVNLPKCRDSSSQHVETLKDAVALPRTGRNVR